MIVDKLENASLYTCISNNLRKGFEFLKNTDLISVSTGRHEIDSNEVFALVSEYDSKNQEDCRLESHRIYTDIQYLVSGKELIGFESLKDQTVIFEYSPEKDIAFYQGEGIPILIEAGMFAVFFPQDVHRPCIQVSLPEKVKKIVVKVKI
jgi:YhcH/YjgK/YiaL family protein